MAADACKLWKLMTLGWVRVLLTNICYTWHSAFRSGSSKLFDAASWPQSLSLPVHRSCPLLFPGARCNSLRKLWRLLVRVFLKLMQSEHDTQSAKDGERTYTKRVMDDLGKWLFYTTLHLPPLSTHVPLLCIDWLSRRSTWKWFGVCHCQCWWRQGWCQKLE